MAIAVTGLSKTFAGTSALRDVSFAVDAGTVHGLLGGNGSGKSTLVKILAGVHRGDPGGRLEAGGHEVAAEDVTPGWAAQAGLSFVHQDLGLFGSLTIAENLFAGRRAPGSRGRIAWRALRRRARADLERVGLACAVEEPLGSLRPAEQTLVAIARALADDGRRAGPLVLDEPTARLPEAEAERLLEAVRRLAASGQTVLYVSHRLGDVLGTCSAVTVLRDGRHVTTQPTDGLDEAGLAALIVGRQMAAATTGPAAPADAAAATTRPVLRVRGLRAGPLRDLTLEVHAGEIVGVAGLVGSGRTTLLEAIFGVRAAPGGAVELDGVPLRPGDVAGAVERGVAYVPEDRLADAVFADLGVAENLSAARPEEHRGRLGFRHGDERTAARADVERFGIRAPGVTAPLHALSGGNQQKVVVARWLRTAPRLLLLDEPTQGVDVGARADLHRHLREAAERGLAVLVVSSDADELVQLADRVLVLRDGAVAARARAGAFDRPWLTEQTYGATPEGALA